ncbi:hypothetical protein [Loigolactobacillus jiayinensis]|mgnify:CR=1 FL=1|uniref:Uncharacterized protein n=1 Tax=Loigolactobacillus jiayinensis TaxID=2486016 RepID=A0ABW1RHB9_9LACO|nr:hypothetical protein [Loigolactobacillus jiayinensis]
MPTHQQTLTELAAGQTYIAVADFQIEPQFDTDQYSARQGDRIQIRGTFPNGAMVYNLNVEAGFFVPRRRVGELFVAEALTK